MHDDEMYEDDLNEAIIASLMHQDANANTQS
jgi:hypothetical protein